MFNLLVIQPPYNDSKELSMFVIFLQINFLLSLMYITIPEHLIILAVCNPSPTKKGARQVSPSPRPAWSPVSPIRVSTSCRGMGWLMASSAGKYTKIQQAATRKNFERIMKLSPTSSSCLKEKIHEHVPITWHRIIHRVIHQCNCYLPFRNLPF